MVDVRGQYARIQSDIDRPFSTSCGLDSSSMGRPSVDFTSDLADWLGHTEEHPDSRRAMRQRDRRIAGRLHGARPEAGRRGHHPSFTFISTVEVIHLLRLTPVMVDVDPCTFTLDPAAVAKAVTPRTKAIMPVHLYGQCADMTALQAVADEHGLALVEDTAQAIGSAWQGADGQWGAAGTMGTIGTTSFFPSKNLGAYGDGGACFTRDAALAERLRMICNHGSRQRYEHEIIGMNSRLDSIQAAILGVKLPHLTAYNAARAEAADRYDALLGGSPDGHGALSPSAVPSCLPPIHPQAQQQGRRTRAEDHLAAHLQAEGVPFGIYYPKAHSPAGCLLRCARRNATTACH